MHGTTGNIRRDIFDSKGSAWGVNDNVQEKNKLASQMIHKRCKFIFIYILINIIFYSVKWWRKHYNQELEPTPQRF